MIPRHRRPHGCGRCARAHAIGGVIAATASFLLPGHLDAQVLVGRVVEAGSEAPIMGAEVRLLGPDGDQHALLVSDSSGFFHVRLSEPGQYAVTARHIAYLPFDSERLDFSRGQTVSVVLRLGRDAIPLEPLVVTARRADRGRLAGFRERSEERAFGRFVTREEIDRRPAAGVSDLFRTIPSVRVVPVNRNGNPSGMTTNLILMRGGATGLCTPTLYLDGIRVGQSSAFPIDDLINPGILEGIEIYGVASAPAEYMSAVDCGVVLLWTREAEGAGRRGWLRHALGGAALGSIILLLALVG